MTLKEFAAVCGKTVIGGGAMIGLPLIGGALLDRVTGLSSGVVLALVLGAVLLTVALGPSLAEPQKPRP